MSFHIPEQYEQYRVRHGVMASDAFDGTCGSFMIPSVIPGRTLVIILSSGADWEEACLPGEPWEHVSIHVINGSGKRERQYTPTWEEMCQAKSIFWDDDDVVIQFHPRKSNYVNIHPHTLHLWRPTKVEIFTPPILTV